MLPSSFSSSIAAGKENQFFKPLLLYFHNHHNIPQPCTLIRHHLFSTLTFTCMHSSFSHSLICEQKYLYCMYGNATNGTDIGYFSTITPSQLCVSLRIQLCINYHYHLSFSHSATITNLLLTPTPTIPLSLLYPQSWLACILHCLLQWVMILPIALPLMKSFCSIYAFPSLHEISLHS